MLNPEASSRIVVIIIGFIFLGFSDDRAEIDNMMKKSIVIKPYK